MGGAVEYWMVPLARVFEAYAMIKYGPAKYVKHSFPVQRMCWTLWIIFCVFPLADNAIGMDWSNPTAEAQRHHSRTDPKFRLPVQLWAVVQIVLKVLSIRALVDPKVQLSGAQKAAVVIMMGFFQGLDINASHELIHKTSRLEQFLGNSLLVNVNYLHWSSEHLHGHHTHVATPGDPASARYNESLYSFLPRTIVGSFISAVRMELQRLEKEGQSKWNPLQNRAFGWIFLPAAWSAAIAKMTGGGMRAIKYFYLQSLFGIILLEIINYVEHYGLSRRKLPDGSYEPVNPTHSWNAPHRLSNAILFKLQRHSMHHAKAFTPYHLLCNYEESPMMPQGYPGMVLISLFSPVFKWIMNPLVRALPSDVAPAEDGTPYQKAEDWKAAERDAVMKSNIFIALVTVATGYAIKKKLHS